MKNNKVMLGIGGAVLAVCLLATCVVGAGGYLYWDQLSTILGMSQSQKTAQMLPADTQFYIAFTPNLQNLPGYQNLKTHYLDNPDIQALIDEIETEVQDEMGMTFEDDIQPWLGTEAVMAAPNFKDAMQDPSGETAPSFVIAAETINPEASNQFIEKLLAKAAEEGDPFTDQTYQEVTIHFQDQEFAEDAYLATFNNLVAVTNDEALLQSMIDRAQGRAESASLAEAPRYQKVMQQLPTEAAMTMYFDFGGIFEAALREADLDLPQEQIADFEAFEGFGLAGTLQPDGVQFDTVISYDAANMSDWLKASLEQPASPNAIHSAVPADALLVYNANNLANIWQQTKRSLEQTPDFAETMDAFEEELGVNLDEDIFSWMTGEFAFVMVEAAPANEWDPPFGGYMLIGTDDVEQAQTKVNKLMGIMEEQGGMPPLETVSVSGIETQASTNYISGAFEAGYGFHDNYFFMAYLEDSVEAMAGAADSSLSNSDNFAAVQERLPAENYGYLYADVDHFRTLIESQLDEYDQEEYETTVQPFVEPIHAIGVSAEAGSAGNGLQKGRFFVLIK